MIAIIDSGIGNVKSVANALAYLKAPHQITTEPKYIQQADKLIFPGQGAFCDGMKAIRKSQLIHCLRDEVLIKGKLYLGICLGLQLLAQTGFEDGKYEGLNWIQGIVRKINTREKLPHVGWNNVLVKDKTSLFKDLPENPTFYFAHSYVIDPKEKPIVTSTCDYGETFVSSVKFHNIYGVQFHPEKSQKNGLQLLKNFVMMES